MKQEEPKKEDQKQGFFFSDLKDIQLISGITAFSAVVITVIAMLFLPTRVDKTLITYVAIFVSAFILIYYTTPFFYLNTRFMILPDAIFSIAISVTMYALKDFGEFYLIFFLLLIAVDAFSFRLKDFIAVIFIIVTALIFSNIFLAKNFLSFNDLVFRLIIQIYSVTSVAVVMRFFAKEALTERKEKEQIRKLAENTILAIKQLRNLLDNIGNGIFAVDENEQIILTNTSAINILGWRKAVSGRKLYEIMPLYNKDSELVDPVKKVIESKKPFSSSEHLIKKVGEEVKVYINITPILTPGGEAQGAIILFRDITREKALEEQRLEFVAVSSHELRTPLTIIEGYLYFLLNNKDLKYDHQSKVYIEKAHKGCLDLQKLIADLLEVSRVEQNRLKIELEKVNILEIAKEVTEEFKKKTTLKGLDLLLEIKQKKIPSCLADKGRLKEVLVNLVENAIKFTEKGYIKIIVEKEKQAIKVGVLDTGPGIEKEDQKYIFDKFYRVEGWRTRKTRGTGLGLYIAKSIIERFGGKIWVESQVGKGSTFLFTVPLEQKKRKREKSKPQKPAKLEEFVNKL